MNNSFVPWGGSEHLWGETALRLQQQGHEILVCMPNWQPLPPVIQRLSDGGARIHRKQPRKFAYYRGRLRSFLRMNPGPGHEAGATADWIAPFLPHLTVISQMMNFDGWAWAEACGKHSLRYVLISHSANELHAPENSEFAAIRDAFTRTEAAYFVSEHNLRLTSDRLGMAIPRTKVIRNPFMVSYDEAPSWPEAEPLKLACVARLDFGKGYDLLFQVLAEPRWRERDFQVSIFGEGRHRLALEAMATQLDLNGKVRFFGHVEDIPAVWRGHHAFILPSRCEGLPVTLIEAALCHRMAIITPAGGSAEVIRDGETGFVAKSITQEALDAAMEQAWHRRLEWREMGLAAGRNVRTLIPRDPVGEFCTELTGIAS